MVPPPLMLPGISVGLTVTTTVLVYLVSPHDITLLRYDLEVVRPEGGL